MSTVPIRYRTDSVYYAMFPAAGERDGKPQPPKEPGDTWPVYNGRSEVTGYAICCPKCGEIHMWCHADNCASLRKLPSGGQQCDHEKAGVSCWTWTGKPEDGTLTARPSLLSTTEKGGCGWHGYLTANTLEGA